MENNTKRHIITPLKGICNAPSELTCNDEQLAVCEGMQIVNGELQPIQTPKKFGTNVTAEGAFIDGKLMFIHDYNGEKRYIYLYQDSTDGWQLWYKKDVTGTSAVKIKTFGTVTVNDVKSIGNTLIINTSDGLYYILWKNGAYRDLGKDIPQPQFYVKLNGISVVEETVTTDGMCHAYEQSGTGSGTCSMFLVNETQQNTFEDAIMGVYAKAKNSLYEKKMFCLPFFVRVALEMYDGTYKYIGAPILMYPCLERNHYFRVQYSGEDVQYTTIRMFGSTLHFLQNTDYSDYSDIVNGVTLFATSPTEISSLIKNKASDGSWSWSSYILKAVDKYGSLTAIPTNTQMQDIKGVVANAITELSGTELRFAALDDKYWHYYDLMERDTEANIIKSLVDNMSFFKIADIGRQAFSSWTDCSSYIGKTTLKNLVTQTHLETDDYYGHTTYLPSKIDTYNRRLCMYNVKRSFFVGFDCFNAINYNDNKEHKLFIIVEIDTPDGKRIIKRRTDTAYVIGSDLWFYYPDPRAKYLYVLYIDGAITNVIYKSELKEHPSLNGAYCLNKLPTSGGIAFPDAIYSEVIQAVETPELIDNYLLQSEVDNPWQIGATSYVRVGNGEIIGIAGLTTALNQDAYKVSTTLCFTTQGIWALLSNDQGRFVNVPPSFSREVCCNADSITMVDGAVFFVSERGLMCVTGASEHGVQCVSEQLSGKGKRDFMAFMKECKIAYDYRDSLLVIYKEGEKDVWIYDIRTATFCKKKNYLSGKKFKTACNNYPDYMVQDEDYTLYSLIEKPLRDDDTAKYSGEIQSRAMKLDGSMYLKSLRRLRKLMMLNAGTTSTIEIYGSNDLATWTKLISLNGKPYRFFKYKCAFSNMSATDVFSGLVLDTQVRYTDKPH